MANHSSHRSLITGLVLLAVVDLTAGHAGACSTPVFRYAMYNWAQAPYLVFYLYHGKPGSDDRKINRAIEGFLKTQPVVVNMVLHSVNRDDPKQFDPLPDPVKEAAKVKVDGQEPRHLIFTPWGALLLSGRLDEATLKAMVDSPARKKVNELLDDGKATVLVLLTGTDAKANEEAEKAIQAAMGRATSGEIPVGDQMPEEMAGVMPPSDPGAEAADGGAASGPPKLEVATLKLDRSDKAEKWLIRNLRLIEPDLNEPKYIDQPMVFAAYGRGRALEPFIGKGITADNLTECIAFLAGACSCQVKDQNPGQDLLVQWDWEATADHLAMNDPMADGNEAAYQEFPAVPSPPSSQTETVASEAADAPVERPLRPQLPAAPVSPDAKEKPLAPASPPIVKPAAAVVPVSPAPASAFSRQMLVLAAGFAVAALGIVGAGLLAISRRSG